MLLDPSNMTRHHVDDYMSEKSHCAKTDTGSNYHGPVDRVCKIGLGVACVIRELVQKELDN